MIPVLETERLLLRQLTSGDVDNLLGIFGDAEAMRFFPSTKTREETSEWIEWNLRSYRDLGFGLWAVTLKDTGAFVGYCGLILQRDVDGRDEIEIGYSLLRSQWGQGLATEAAIACRQFALARLGFYRVISLIDPGNTASTRVAARNGMTRETSVHRWGKQIDVYGTVVKSPNFDVRSERASDVDDIRRIHTEAFGQDSEARLVEMLRSSGKLTHSFVAIAAGRPIAHVALSPVSLESGQKANIVGIAPIAVLREYQRNGAGSLLMRHALDQTAKSACDAVVLLGWPPYYRRFGFIDARRFGLSNEYVDNDEFMVCPLRADALKDLTGLLKYQPEFAAVN